MEHILIIEDKKDVNQLLSRTLQDAEHIEKLPAICFW